MVIGHNFMCVCVCVWALNIIRLWIMKMTLLLCWEMKRYKIKRFILVGGWHFVSIRRGKFKSLSLSESVLVVQTSLEWSICPLGSTLAQSSFMDGLQSETKKKKTYSIEWCATPYQWSCCRPRIIFKKRIGHHQCIWGQHCSRVTWVIIEIMVLVEYDSLYTIQESCLV